MCFTFQKAIIIKIIVGYIALATALSCPNIFGQSDVKSHRVVIRESQQVFAKEKRSIDRSYHEYIAKLNDGYQKKVTTLRKQVVSYLEKARDELAKNLDLNGANEVQKEINSYDALPIEFPNHTINESEQTQLVGHLQSDNEAIIALQNEVLRLKQELSQADSSNGLTSRTLSKNAIPISRSTSTEIPFDAIRFNGHSYKLFGKGYPFSAAARICSSQGGHLVVIDTAEELDFLRQLANRNPFKVDQFWVNATDDLKEGDWRTIDGARLPIMAWGPGEPSNTAGKGGQEHYASISRKANWLLNDNQGVYRSYGFICEWDY